MHDRNQLLNRVLRKSRDPALAPLVTLVVEALLEEERKDAPCPSPNDRENSD